jgi:hypothetical protein
MDLKGPYKSWYPSLRARWLVSWYKRNREALDANKDYYNKGLEPSSHNKVVR